MTTTTNGRNKYAVLIDGHMYCNPETQLPRWFDLADARRRAEALIREDPSKEILVVHYVAGVTIENQIVWDD